MNPFSVRWRLTLLALFQDRLGQRPVRVHGVRLPLPVLARRFDHHNGGGGDDDSGNQREMAGGEGMHFFGALLVPLLS